MSANSQQGSKRKEQTTKPRDILRVVLFTKEDSRALFHEILFWFFLGHFVKFNKAQKKLFQDHDLSHSEDNELDSSMDEQVTFLMVAHLGIHWCLTTLTRITKNFIMLPFLICVPNSTI